MTDEELAEEAVSDMRDVIESWDRTTPLRWTAGDFLDYMRMEARPEDPCFKSAYAATVREKLPEMVAAERAAFERLLSGFIATRGLAGLSGFTFKRFDDAESAYDQVRRWNDEAETQQQKEAARQSRVSIAKDVLWETYRDGKLVYGKLFREIV